MKLQVAIDETESGPIVHGSIAEWPVDAARVVVAAMSLVSDGGCLRAFMAASSDSDAVSVGDDDDGSGEDVTLYVSPRHEGPAAGPEWDAALRAVLRAQQR